MNIKSNKEGSIISAFVLTVQNEMWMQGEEDLIRVSRPEQMLVAFNNYSLKDFNRGIDSLFWPIVAANCEIRKFDIEQVKFQLPAGWSCRRDRKGRLEFLSPEQEIIGNCRIILYHREPNSFYFYFGKDLNNRMDIDFIERKPVKAKHSKKIKSQGAVR